MDWKDLLNSKIAEGVLTREESNEEVISDVDSTNNNDILNVILDKKGRKGKVATIVTGFTCDDSKLKEIATALKVKLGTGGSSRGGEILIQGDRVNDVKKWLKESGYKVR